MLQRIKPSGNNIFPSNYDVITRRGTSRARTGIGNINNEFNSFRDDGWNAELVYMCAGAKR